MGIQRQRGQTMADEMCSVEAKHRNKQVVATADLGQKHLSRPEEVSNHIHAIHERSFNDLQGRGVPSTYSGFLHILHNTHTQCVTTGVSSGTSKYGTGVQTATVLGAAICEPLHMSRNSHQSIQKCGCSSWHTVAALSCRGSHTSINTWHT